MATKSRSACLLLLCRPHTFRHMPAIQDWARPDRHGRWGFQLVSERLQRLRQYSSNFSNSIFNHEDLETHTDYVRKFHDLEWNFSMCTDGSTSAMYGNFVRLQSFFSIYTHSSAQAGIQSHCWLMPVGTPGDETRWMRTWAIDCAQDLLVTIELVTIDPNTRCVLSSCSLG